MPFSALKRTCIVLFSHPIRNDEANLLPFKLNYWINTYRTLVLNLINSSTEKCIVVSSAYPFCTNLQFIVYQLMEDDFSIPNIYALLPTCKQPPSQVPPYTSTAYNKVKITNNVRENMKLVRAEEN